MKSMQTTAPTFLAQLSLSLKFLHCMVGSYRQGSFDLSMNGLTKTPIKSLTTSELILHDHGQGNTHGRRVGIL
ncbi:hypothetical protein SAMN04487974_102155 [Pelagibacterium luteolum]|uniref:Uncharacterized protein n=1 Tax=Pelagibacterium luteolum TaxID=440168 RepID=A0A1G7TIT3_9HYPH|nr:hypothetical protein SAMN04487974_102155 [Pelagibacterium luteolum]